MKYKFLPVLLILLIIPNQIFAEEPELIFPKSKAEIIKALQAPKIRTRSIKVVAPKVGAMIQFDYNSARISSDACDLLNIYASVFQNELSDSRIMIVGHTDSIGSNAYNEKLSILRARAIKNYFMQQGVVSKRLTVRGLGESHPIASNLDEQGRALNRRVEFVRLSDNY